MFDCHQKSIREIDASIIDCFSGWDASTKQFEKSDINKTVKNYRKSHMNRVGTKNVEFGITLRRNLRGNISQFLANILCQPYPWISGDRVRIFRRITLGMIILVWFCILSVWVLHLTTTLRRTSFTTLKINKITLK